MSHRSLTFALYVACVSFEPYSVLGLPRGASDQEVRRAYRRLAQESHPDTNGPEGIDRFITVKNAYEAISREKQGSTYGPTGEALVPRSSAVPAVDVTVLPPPPLPLRVDLFDVLAAPSVTEALGAYRRQTRMAPPRLVDLRG